MGLTKAVATSDNRKLGQVAEKVARAVILSGRAVILSGRAVILSGAKDLQYLLGIKQMQILRSAQDDR
jgi:hypothetical protein